MQLQVILNAVERHGSFVYERVRWTEECRRGLEIVVRPRKNSRPICPKCGQRGAIHSYLPERRFQHVPFWGLMVWLVYSRRRVQCGRCPGGPRAEYLPWARGHKRITLRFEWFLARWAKRLSWQQTADVFGTSWDTVFRAVKMAVCWGLRHRQLDGIGAIGVDEVAYRKGHKYLTLVYQIDAGSRRLLWVGHDRTKQTLERFFRQFGRRRTEQLKYICSDMCGSYLAVIAEQARGVIHILDRFHIMQLFNKAIDKVRADEARRLKAQGLTLLKNTRWLLLKRRDNLSRREVPRLKELLAHNLSTVKCYLMKEDFQRFWGYVCPRRIAYFLEEWMKRARRTQIEPMKKLADTLDRHSEQIFNWFTAKGEISAGAVEAMNLKVKLTTRKSYGFRGKNTIKYALYHNLAQLPEPLYHHKYGG